MDDKGIKEPSGRKNCRSIGYYCSAYELSGIIGCTRETAGKLIRIFNKELREKGYITAWRRVPRAYLKKRIWIADE